MGPREADPNRALLAAVAGRLGPALCEDLVFVGGCVAGLLITDPGQAPMRPTKDVDVVAHLVATVQWYALCERLRERGFVEDRGEGAPVCRWRHGALMLDVMPTLPEVLGFANRWYPLAVETATRVELPEAGVIRLISAPAFLATKLEAFDGRGQGDHLMSHDLEDVAALVDGRATLPDEVAAAPARLRNWVARRLADLLADRRFTDSLGAFLPPDAASQARLPGLIVRLRLLVAQGGRDRP